MGGCCGQWRAVGGCVMAVAACLGLYCCVSCIQHKCYNTRQKCFSKMECDKRDSCATTWWFIQIFFSFIDRVARGVWMTIQSVPADATKFSFVHMTLSSLSCPAILIKPRRTSKDGCHGVRRRQHDHQPFGLAGSH